MIIQWLTWGLWGLLSVAYLISDRNSFGQMFGVWPAWFWMLGIWLLILASHRNWKQTSLLAGAWLGFLLYFSEEWQWAFHPLQPDPPSAGDIRHKQSPGWKVSNSISEDITYNLVEIPGVGSAGPSSRYLFFSGITSSQSASPEIIRNRVRDDYVDKRIAILSRYPVNITYSVHWLGDPSPWWNNSPGKKLFPYQCRLIQPELGLFLFRPAPGFRPGRIRYPR